VFAAQLALTGAAVIIAEAGAGGRLQMAAVVAAALVNALVVAFLAMGVRRDGRLVAVFAIAVAVVLVGLLAWPAWDVYERAKVF
jgi:heme/copper-type cytochrome/quinol oxidase subunit 4